MASGVSASSVYTKLFAKNTESDPFKRPKTKVRKGKAYKKELKRQRQSRKKQRILKGRLRNESILLQNLKESYPGIANIEKLAKNVKVVEDSTGKTIDQAKIDKIVKKLLTKTDLFTGKTNSTKNKVKESIKEKKEASKQKEVSASVKRTQQKESKTKKRDNPNIDDTKSNKVNKRTNTAILKSTKPKSKSAPKPLQSTKNIKLSEISSEAIGIFDFKWILGDKISIDKFFRDHWEKAPLLVSGRKVENYYKNLITSQLIDQILRDNFIEYTKNIDITSYTDGQRETHNPEGRALPQVVWDYYQNGCSVRFLNPQSYIRELQNLNANLQELFGCFVGANTYLTPPNSQGFAPHYDDIEAFILQLEGKKQWKVYAPRTPGEHLPRYSSPNFRQEDIGSPTLEAVLCPGDLLYLPRGYIHQASTVPGQHSLHVTISVYQRTAWVDLLEKALPKALQAAAAADVEFRRGLPLGYLRQAGLARARASAERTLLKKTLRGLVARLGEYVDLDLGVDEMGKQMVHEALPPVLSSDELQCSVFENGMRIAEDGRIVNQTDVGLDSKLRLVRANACRLVEQLNEENALELCLYYSVDNSLEYRGKEPQFLILPPVARPALLRLFTVYPAFTSVADLLQGRVSEEHREECVQVIRDLWERGVLISEEPLPSSD